MLEGIGGVLLMKFLHFCCCCCCSTQVGDVLATATALQISTLYPNVQLMLLLLLNDAALLLSAAAAAECCC